MKITLAILLVTFSLNLIAEDKGSVWISFLDKKLHKCPVITAIQKVRLMGASEEEIFDIMSLLSDPDRNPLELDYQHKKYMPERHATLAKKNNSGPLKKLNFGIPPEKLSIGLRCLVLKTITNRK